METIGYYKSRFLAGPMTWAFCLSEMKELAEAVLEADLQHIHEEWNDVCICLQSWFAEYLPIGWTPILPGFGLFSARKFAARISVWQQIFAHHGVDFQKEFLFAGSNYRKRHKVSAVLRQGGCEEVDFEWVGTLVGGFED